MAKHLGNEKDIGEKVAMKSKKWPEHTDMKGSIN